MKFANLIFTKDEEFLRLTGIKHSTFNKMIKNFTRNRIKKILSWW